MTETKTKQKSYFAKEVVNRYQLDDGESFIEHRKLDEGLFQQYQDLTSKVKLSGDSTEVDMRLGAQRRFLFENLVTGWNLVDESDKPVKFTPSRLLELPPHVMSGLFDHIHECNEILNSGDSEADPKAKNN